MLPLCLVLPLTTGDEAFQAQYKVVSLAAEKSMAPDLHNVCPPKVSQIGESSPEIKVDKQATISRWEFPVA